ncbi:hypothetical protein [Fulvivirga lutimaris]|uniref:hypothetical protein n=1 Tax=Fulvivirga lutimaris TaxID=1819566 RepID=UPI0012BCB580|nr:hypothetical protein [Fulvivirga lutimaris]MTI41539.1 hypothetical protein [Fulvivirga lutimaris]
MNKYIFTLLFLIPTWYSYAQQDFEDGLVITNEGDTIPAKIENNDWKKNPQNINYQTSEGTAASYSPTEIKGFFIESSQEWYQSAIMELDKSSLKDGDVVNGRHQTGVQLDTVFLRLLIKGKLSLYTITDENSREHFVIDGGKGLEELRIGKKKVTEEYQGVTVKEGVVNLDYWKPQLDAAIADCPSVTYKHRIARYEEKTFVKLITAYNNCGGQNKSTYVKPTEKAILNLALSAGAINTKMSLEGNDYGKVNTNPDAVITPYLGLSFDVLLPRSNRSWSISNDLLYRSYNIDDFFKVSQIKLITTLRYRFPSKSNSRFFIGAGLNNGVAVKREIDGEKANEFMRGHEQGLLFELGLQSKKLGYIFRYESTNGFSPYLETNTVFKNLHFGLTYLLNH